MPSDEKTMYNQETLHVVFAISSLVMLVTTIWMMVDDHMRQWKDYQRTTRTIQTKMTSWRIEEQKSRQYFQKLEEAEKRLINAQSIAPAQKLIEDFKQEAQKIKEIDVKELDDALKTLSDTNEPERAKESRTELINAMKDIIRRAEFLKDRSARLEKNESANLNEYRSKVGLAISTGRFPDEIKVLQGLADKQGKKVAEISIEHEERTTQHLALQNILKQITHGENEAAKALEQVQAGVQRLETVKYEGKGSFWRSLLEMPIIDPFRSPLQIENLWLPNLPINNNFKDVARFDRCTTCHQLNEATLPGSTVDPAYVKQYELDHEIHLATPKKQPESQKDQDGNEGGRSLEAIYGMRLADEGLLHPNDVTISVVWSKKTTLEGADSRGPAAEAGLMSGDVILSINGTNTVNNRSLALQLLIEIKPDDWGQPLRLKIRRGLPHPYVTHPRLDLFVGDTSAHPKKNFGCTICHQGQGSATTFKWASHTPNTLEQAEQWEEDLGWEFNHHWVFPMHPKRFAQSSCLQCHHDVTDLESSEKFQDPAPKLVEGYNLIRRYGCFGCHEINGYARPERRIGPDLRAEPNYVAVAKQLLTDPGLTSSERALAQRLVKHPEEDSTRKRLFEWLRTDYKLMAQMLKYEYERLDKLNNKDNGSIKLNLTDKQLKLVNDVLADPNKRAARQSLAAAIQGQSEEKELIVTVQQGYSKRKKNPARLKPHSHRVATLLKEIKTPGQFRRVGPSLRHLAKKLDKTVLFHWIRNPQTIRPSTRMPRFFGLYNHLEGESLAESQKFEPIEIRAITEYLLSASQEFQYIQPPKEFEGLAVEEGSPERGKILFLMRGCVACHKHSDVRDGNAKQGPDLSQLGLKLTGPMGQQWLYAWLRDPVRYHARTKMPQLFLELIPHKDKEGKIATVTDPAADLVEYLLQKREGDRFLGEIPQLNTDALDELAEVHLRKSFTSVKVSEYLKKGIYDRKESHVKSDETELLVPDGKKLSDEELQNMKLRFVGRRSISKYGCAGCHDIPGYETAKPIGTSLAEWGRKDPSKLAFEHIAHYVNPTHPETSGEEKPLSEKQKQVQKRSEYFKHALLEHHREGFIWQKLSEPRSFDYKTTDNKSYNDRLRMPQFPLTDDQKEAIMTFVLGLVSDPPPTQYVYHPSARRKAIVQGRKVLDKYNCAGCHILKNERWEIEYEPGDFIASAPKFDDFIFIKPYFTPDQIEQSIRIDRREMRHATLIGKLPQKILWHLLDEEAYDPEEDFDDEEDLEKALKDGVVKWYYQFTLTEPVLLDGRAFYLGKKPLMFPVERAPENRRRPAVGGDMARWVFQEVLRHLKKENPTAKEAEAPGWFPPSLEHEGRKVQTGWLHDFLLNPYVIRPSTILRMPKFNMSSDEARKLVNYFAAVDKVQSRYDFSPSGRQQHLEMEASKYLANLPPEQRQNRHRLGDAMRIVTNKSYCVTCHLVGDFNPGGNPKALAPDLASVHRRLRPDFVRQWIANPKRILSYTGMPVNILHKKPLDQKLYQGSSVEQIDAIVDLLMNWYSENSKSIKPSEATKAPDAPNAAAP